MLIFSCSIVTIRLYLPGLITINFFYESQKDSSAEMGSSTGFKGEAGGAHMYDVRQRTFSVPGHLAFHYRRIYAGCIC